MNARQVQVDQLADALHWADLQVGRQAGTQGFAVALGTRGEDERRHAEQLQLADRADQYPILPRLQGQLDGLLLQHHRQQAANGLHQPAKARTLIAVLIVRLQRATLAVMGERR